jgi:hypothetical protein
MCCFKVTYLGLLGLFCDVQATHHVYKFIVSSMNRDTSITPTATHDPQTKTHYAHQ